MKRLQLNSNLKMSLEFGFFCARFVFPSKATHQKMKHLLKCCADMASVFHINIIDYGIDVLITDKM